MNFPAGGKPWFVVTPGPFDAWLTEMKLDPQSLSGLPDFSELGYSAQTVPQTFCSPPQTYVEQDIDSHLRRDGFDVAAGLEDQADVLVFHGLFGDVTGEDAAFVFDFLQNTDASQRHVVAGDSWPPKTPGYLDLFSGEKGVAFAWVALTGVWCLTFEIEDGAAQDLNDDGNRQSIARLLALGIFLAWGAAPVCFPFSVAITPPVRTLLQPEGLENVSNRMWLRFKKGIHSRPGY